MWNGMIRLPRRVDSSDRQRLPGCRVARYFYTGSPRYAHWREFKNAVPCVYVHDAVPWYDLHTS